MSLIRSEHINDKAVGEAKEAVDAAENALEESRSYLEKRERAQYHEEQIWSDTIRRNSTWVTFGLMGVNIFILLLSLLILEPWRRRRMVREIKNAMEAQKTAVETAHALTPATAFVAANPVTEVSAAPPAVSAQPVQPSAANETEVVKVAEFTSAPAEPTTPVVVEPHVDESSTAGTEEPTNAVNETHSVVSAITQEIAEPAVDPTVPGAAPLITEEVDGTPQEVINIDEEVTEPLSTSDQIWAKFGLWKSKVSIVAEDIVSDRPISMRRVDFTTAILQGAAAGAVIAAATIAMLLRPN